MVLYREPIAAPGERRTATSHGAGARELPQTPRSYVSVSWSPGSTSVKTTQYCVPACKVGSSYNLRPLVHMLLGMGEVLSLSKMVLAASGQAVRTTMRALPVPMV